MTTSPARKPDYAGIIYAGDLTHTMHRLPRQPELPEAQLGHCMVCGAGFFEHIACESGNCHFVRTTEEGPA